MAHIILAILWILYGVLHSLLATSWMKQVFRHSKYYTFIYSLFAALSLAAILVYQFAIPQIILWVMPSWPRLLLLLPMLAGLFIMAALIKKYFFALSGISAFYKTQPPVKLELDGWHRYVRHPLYSGTLLFIWSLFFMFPLLSNLIAASIITVYTLAGTVLEEKKLVMQFGKAYSDYQQRVPMLIPSFRRTD